VGGIAKGSRELVVLILEVLILTLPSSWIAIETFVVSSGSHSCVRLHLDRDLCPLCDALDPGHVNIPLPTT
jgi:hypothetical protein